jgi:hypothetical protein
MKRLIIVVLALGVISAAFYWGYQQATPLNPLSSSKSIRVNSTITFEYQPIIPPNGKTLMNSRFEGSSPNAYLILEGDRSSISFLIQNIVSTNYSKEIDDIECDQSLNDREGKVFLKFPKSEPLENVLNKISADLELTYLISDTTITSYNAAWNGQAVSNTVSIAQPGSPEEGPITGNTKCRFKNKSAEQIIDMVRMFFHVFIKNNTGLADTQRFDGEFTITSLASVKQDLKNNMGIELIPIDKKIRKLIVKAK